MRKVRSGLGGVIAGEVGGGGGGSGGGVSVSSVG